MKIYSHSKVSQKAIDYKKKYVNDVVKKIYNGSASMNEISTACDMVTWLWKWKVIDREESGRLADLLADAMEGKYPDDSWDNEDNYFKGE